MSKALNPLSIAVGKLGNAVYYKLKYSSTGQKQGIREYVPQPSNPQTTAQIDQRIKMTTVTNCYRMFGDVIRRAFEGVEYGQPSYARWSSLALGQSFAGPFMPKDWKAPAPVLGVPMSLGSLPQVTVEAGSSDGTLKTSLSIADDGDTIGDLSQNLLNANSWLQSNDQITICLISTNNVPLGDLYGHHWSFYLNVNDTSSIPHIAGCELGVQDNTLGFFGDDNDPLCACVIVSREGSHLRSTSYWGVNSFFSQMYTTELDDATRNTYKKSAKSKTSDWPVDPTTRVPADAFPYTVKSGAAVNLLSLRVEDGWLCATGTMTATGTTVTDLRFKCVDVRSGHYNRWLTSYNSDTSTAPDDADDSNTIEYQVSTEATAQQIKLLDWLFANGVDDRWMYIGD